MSVQKRLTVNALAAINEIEGEIETLPERETNDWEFCTCRGNRVRCDNPGPHHDELCNCYTPF